MIEPFETKEAIDLNNEYILETQSSKYWKMILSFCIILIIIIILGIIVIKLSMVDFEKNKIQVICKYDIKNANSERLLNEKFDTNYYEVSMYIDDKLQEYKNDTSNIDKTGIHTVKYLFNRILKLENMFKNIDNVISINISSNNGYLDDSLSHAFSNCTRLESLSLNVNTRNSEDMSYMFFNCNNLKNVNFNLGNNKQNTNKTKFTSIVKDMTSMFSGCTSLTSINLTLFDTKNANNFTSMFENCKSLKSLNLSNFNTSLITNMELMFSNCTEITSIDIFNFNTSLVNNMSYMFYNCQNLKTLNYSELFKPCKNDTDTGSMFDNCPVDKPNWYTNDSIIDFL